MPDREPLQIAQVTERTLIRLSSSAPYSALSSLVPPGLGGDARILPLGPTEWCVVSHRIEGTKLREQLERHVRGEGIAAVDLSCAIKSLRVEGPAARAVLAKGCGLDLHPSRFPTGRCTRTRLAQLGVILECTDPAPRFDLYVGRSYLKWLRAWLVDAATEFQGSIKAPSG